MLQQQIRDELTGAMKAREETRVSVLRGLITAFTNELVATKRKPQDELSDDEVLNLIKRAVKQRKDSIDQFTKGGRKDLADSELAELVYLEKYLPETMSLDEIEKVAKSKKEELGIDDKAKMGMLMGAIMKELGSKADGGDVKEVVERLF
jgi:hypothetical protein